jgi:hypothetical protein
MTNSATGSHQRLRIQANPGCPQLHGTVIPGTYDLKTQNFEIVLDVQLVTNPPLVMTHTSGATYVDQNGLLWTVIS